MQPLFAPLPCSPRVRRWLGPLGLVVLLLQFSPDARAALGDDESVLAADQARLGAKVKVMRRPSYAIHELTMATGATVRELVNDTGKVFAVSWSGGWRPNLRHLMGSHYDRFIAGTRGRRATRGIVRIELPGMTVVMGGHLRTFFGKVVLTELLPAGITLEELR